MVHVLATPCAGVMLTSGCVNVAHTKGTTAQSHPDITDNLSCASDEILGSSPTSPLPELFRNTGDLTAAGQSPTATHMGQVWPTAIGGSDCPATSVGPASMCYLSMQTVGFNVQGWVQALV